MVTVEIVSTGEQLEVLNSKISYTKQVADIGDVTTANASHSWNFEVPKTPKNTRTVESLGIVGDTSQAPYIKLYCRLLDNGTPIVSMGLLNIRSTEDTYKMFIQEGIVDFYNDISNDKIGEVIDLSSLQHSNTTPNIIDTWRFDFEFPYRYLVADYGGAPLANVVGVTNLNPFGLVPSIDVRWLLDKIFEYYGWTYSGLLVQNFWMTYPTALGFEEANNFSAGYFYDMYMERRGTNEFAQKYGYIGTNKVTGQDSRYIGFHLFDETDPNIPVTYRVRETANFKITFKVIGTVRWSDRKGLSKSSSYTTYLVINDTRIPVEMDSQDYEGKAEYSATLQAGDRVRLESYAELSTKASNVNWYIHNHSDGVDAHINFDVLGVQNVDFQEALIKYKVSDFFKEIMVRYALTAFVDIETKSIEFYSLNQRMTAETVDWTSKYVRRIKEDYIYDNYAKNNYLKHKYDKDGEDYADGNLAVRNENLSPEKTLYQSNSYAPLPDLVTYNKENGGTYAVPTLKMFEIEVKLNEVGDVIADYKGLKDRFHFAGQTAVYGDIYVSGNVHRGFFYVADMSKTTFDKVVLRHYNEIPKILEDTRIHTIEVALTKYDMLSLDLRKKVFFAQEQAYYLLNKLTWKPNETCIGEFVRIKSE